LSPPSSPSPLIVIAGPTGSGKSDLAIRLASAIGGEIVNYDSIQIYTGFDIGSAKPTPAERALVPHHLLDIADARDEVNAVDFAGRAREACEEITARGKRVILVGGTFFYLRALLAGLPDMPGRDDSLRVRLARIASRPRGTRRLHRWLLAVDPLSGAKIAAGDRHRVERALEVWISSGRPISSWQTSGDELPSLKLALRMDKAQLREKLDRRAEEMFRKGLVSETASLLARHPAGSRPFSAIGYREAAAVVRGEMDEAEAIAEVRRRTRAYAKRQMTWLRSERNVHWLDASDKETAFAEAMRLTEESR
jgi:tRNA dimethylallyltransferase